jgi:LysR family transcriptional regulator, glycine cleavage system transcriptional activator
MAQQPSLTALRAFEAVARHASFTRAAEELSVTQGAVSHQVLRLEAAVGQRLLERGHRSVSLTPAGARLAAAATDAFARLDEAVQALRRRAPESVLTVSVPPSFATRWLVPRLERFQALAPDVDVRLSATDARVDPVRDGVDVCIRYAKDGATPGLATTLLVAEDVFPVCNPSLLRGKVALRAPADLRRASLLHVEPREPDPDLPDWSKWLRAAKVRGHDAHAGPRFSHAGLALSAALAGQGVALGRTSLVVDDLVAGRLARPFATSFRSRFAYWVSTPPGHATRKKTRAFRVWLEEEIALTVAAVSAAPRRGAATPGGRARRRARRRP